MPPISRSDAAEVFKFYQAAINDGFKANGTPSAKTEGAKRFNAARLKDKRIHRVTFLQRLETAIERHGFKPKIPKSKGPTKADLAGPPKLGGSPIDRSMVQKDDEISRLRKALKDAHRQALNDDAMREILGSNFIQPARPPKWLIDTSSKKAAGATPEVPCVMWADWHLGEVVDPAEVNHVNSYNMAIAEQRIERLIKTTINLCRNHHTGNYPGIVINAAGDFVSGGLHPELLKTDEEEVLPTVVKAVDLMAAGVEQMLETFGHVYMPFVAGNHGRQTQKPEYKRYIYKNFDWLIAQMLIRHFKKEIEKGYLQIDIRPSNDVHYRVYGQRFLLVHGDQLGVKGGDGLIGSIGPVMRGSLKKSAQSQAIGLDFDMLLMGHWHQQLWLPRAIVSNTLKGFDEFARLALGASPSRPSQPLFFMHPRHGMTSHWDMYVDDPPKPNGQPWVSVFKDAA